MEIRRSTDRDANAIMDIFVDGLALVAFDCIART